MVAGAASAAAGSSPLTRGKLAAIDNDFMVRGLIPAHAGKTVEVDVGDREGGGSSPLTRGKRGRRRPDDPPNGLIPAHAGKTRRALSSA